MRLVTTETIMDLHIQMNTASAILGSFDGAGSTDHVNNTSTGCVTEKVYFFH